MSIWNSEFCQTELRKSWASVSIISWFFASSCSSCSLLFLTQFVLHSPTDKKESKIQRMRWPWIWTLSWSPLFLKPSFRLNKPSVDSWNCTCYHKLKTMQQLLSLMDPDITLERLSVKISMSIPKAIDWRMRNRSSDTWLFDLILPDFKSYDCIK